MGKCCLLHKDMNLLSLHQIIRNMKTPKILLLILVTALMTGCCACRSYQKRTRRPLTGAAWQLVQLYGRSIQPEEGKFLLTFSAEEGRLAGVGACNRIAGKFTTDESRALKLGPILSTRMACPGLEQEQQFIRALESATHYDMDGPMMLLFSDGEIRAVFQALPAAAE